MIRTVCIVVLLLQLDLIQSFHHNNLHLHLHHKIKICQSLLNCADNNNDVISNKDSYMFTSDDEIISDSKRNTIDIKRFIGFNLLAGLLAFGANFLGITSLVLSNVNSDYFRSLKLDQIYSINSYLRIVNDGYMYIFPDNWIADQRLQVMAANNRELPILLQQKQKSLPNSAHQRAGSKGKLENVSVIKSKILPGFSLRGTLGSPKEAASALLEVAAPLPKVATLIQASDETRQGRLYYIYEYIVEKPGTDFNQHIISVITCRDTELYTMTVQAPSIDWESEKSIIMKIANSFEIINS